MFNKPRVPQTPQPNAGMHSGVLKSANKNFIAYAFIASFLLSLPALRFLGSYTNAQTVFIFFQVGVIAAGFVHAWYIRYRLAWGDNLLVLKQIVFTFLTAGGGALFFFLIGRFLLNIGHERFSLPEILMFLPVYLIFPVPFMIAMTFEFAIYIPKKKYKLWFYSEDQKLPDFDLIDFSNSIILSFEFPKRFNDSSVSNFKFKAPVNMTFSDLFYGYLNEYNDAHRENPIEFQDNDGKAYGWLFYLKTGSRWRTVILDPHLTVGQNGIKQNFIIAPKRFVTE